jgi:Mn2+/Fe2+ NRAMP family transporter
MLLYAATINGLILVPILVIIMKIVNDKRILGNRVNGLFSNIIGWSITVINLIFSNHLHLFKTFLNYV